MTQAEKMFFNKPVILLLLILMTTTNGFVQEDRLTRRERIQREIRVSFDRQLENSQNLPIRNSDITRQITQKDENTARLYDRRSFRTGTDNFASRNREIDINNNERKYRNIHTAQQDSRREGRNLRVLGERRYERQTNRDTKRHSGEIRDITSTSRILNSRNQLSFRREVREFGNEFRSSEMGVLERQFKSIDTTNDRQRAFGHRLSSRESEFGQISATGNQDQSTRRVIKRDLSSTRRDVRNLGEEQPKPERYTRQRDRNYRVDQDRRFRVNFRDKTVVQRQQRDLRSFPMSRQYNTVERGSLQYDRERSTERRERNNSGQDSFRSGEDRRIIVRKLEARSDIRSKTDRFNLVQDRLSSIRMPLGQQKSDRRTNIERYSPVASKTSGYSERKAENSVDRKLNSFRIVGDISKMKISDSISCISMIKTILAAFLIGQILISSSKANKSRFYNTITSLTTYSKSKVQ